MRLLIVLVVLFGIKNNPRFIDGGKFSGYIFDENHLVLIQIEDQKSRYTPSDNDIYLAENVIKEKLKEANINLLNQGNNCPIIHEKLKRYIRQYVGFKNIRGEKIIYVNFVWKNKDLFDRLSKDIVIVHDGCSYYWSVKVNLNQRILSELRINGNG